MIYNQNPVLTLFWRETMRIQNKRIASIYSIACAIAMIMIVAVPAFSSAGSSSLTVNGDQYYAQSNTAFSSHFANGIVCAPGLGQTSIAYYLFSIDPVPPTYSLSVSVYIYDSAVFGTGAELHIYDWNTATWDNLGSLGRSATDRWVTSGSISTADYVSSGGSVYFDVYAVYLDAVHIGLASVSWSYDDVPPSNPNGFTSTPLTSTWTNDNTIQVTWSGDTDDRNGIGGYSYQWSTSVSTIPDAVSDTTGTSTTSAALADGTWYLHVRTKDGVNNWNSGAYHIGPFWIDTTSPTNPTGYTSVPNAATWTNDNTISVTWSGASDAGSGVHGYSFIWSQISNTVPDTVEDTTGTSTTSSALADGSWYLHVRAVDNLGQYASSAYHIGPFTIDTTNPPSPSLSGLAAWTSDNTPQLSWAAPTDASGISGYSYSIDATPDNTVDTASLSTNAPTLTEGIHQFYVKACDNAGNWGLPSSNQFGIDTTKPTGSIVINGGDNCTKSTTVSLTLTRTDALSGVKQVRYSNDNVTWNSWQSNSTTKSWDLSSGDGTKTVYYQVMDNADLTSDVYSDSIVLDTACPTLTLAKSNGTIFSTGSPMIQWTSADTLTGIDCFEYSVDGGAFVSCGQATSVNLSGLTDGNHTVTIRAIDKAGNNVEDTLAFKVDTSVISASGPLGLGLYIIIIVIIAAIVLALLLIMRRKKNKASEAPPQTPPPTP